VQYYVDDRSICSAFILIANIIANRTSNREVFLPTEKIHRGSFFETATGEECTAAR
jgi:hypothetical protein